MDTYERVDFGCDHYLTAGDTCPIDEKTITRRVTKLLDTGRTLNDDYKYQSKSHDERIEPLPEGGVNLRTIFYYPRAPEAVSSDDEATAK